MKHSNTSPLEHYNLLLETVGDWGRYQAVLTMVTSIYWFSSGINEAMFELTLSGRFKV